MRSAAGTARAAAPAGPAQISLISTPRFASSLT